MRKVVQWIIIAALLLLAINVFSEPANATATYVEVSTFPQLKSALTDPAGAKVKLMADITISTTQAENADCGISLGEGHYTLHLNGHTLKYEHIGLSGDPEGVPIIASRNRSLTIEGTGRMVGGTYGLEQGGRQGILLLNGGSLEGVMGSGMRMTGGLAYLNAGTVTGNFYGVFHEDGIVVRNGATVKSVVYRNMGAGTTNYGVIQNDVFTGAAVLDDFVLAVNNLTIASGSSLSVERRGGLIVQNAFQNLGSYAFHAGLESLGGQAVLKNEAQVQLISPTTFASLTINPQCQLMIQNAAMLTVNGPYVNTNGGIIAVDGIVVLNGSIDHRGHAEGIPQLEALQQAGSSGGTGLGAPNEDVIDTSQPASWAQEHIDRAQKSWLPETRLYSFYQKNIKREEFCELVIQLYQTMAKVEVPVPEVNPFTDISLQYVLKAHSLGIVNGRGEGIFDPFGLITRQEMATMYARLLAKLNISPVVTMEYVLFADEANISDYAKAPLQLMYKLDIIMGEGNGVMAPLKNSSRETAIVISNRIFEKYAVID